MRRLYVKRQRCIGDCNYLNESRISRGPVDLYTEISSACDTPKLYTMSGLN